ncbi:hypothetical protein PIB30_075017 [Stylosanthes scabra]|uniref:Uncharacterized protein n=1 Tax=Stylosanthes scabra TaxID=79078 RepID=A0ABU6SRS8_9FABA|nr:hypothetical protein [Stylosanthes scabra]
MAVLLPSKITAATARDFAMTTSNSKQGSEADSQVNKKNGKDDELFDKIENDQAGCRIWCCAPWGCSPCCKKPPSSSTVKLVIKNH